MKSIDLSKHYNAHAATFDRDRACGTVNAWGNSFPAEELPFGGSLTLGGVRFDLPPKTDGAPDHLEALGQLVQLPSVPSLGLALLVFGEMGEQSLGLSVRFSDGTVEQRTIRACAWLVQGSPPPDETRLSCSHLHYVGGYELTHLRPTLWCARVAWTNDSPTELRLGANPFFHVMAATSLSESADD